MLWDENSTSTTCAVLLKTARFGGQPAVVAQWQSTCSSSQGCPGFASWWLLTFWLLYFCLITSKFIYFQQKAILWAFRARKTLGMGSFLTERISQSTPNSWRVLAFSLSSMFCLITSKFIYFQQEARCSEQDVTSWINFCVVVRAISWACTSSTLVLVVSVLQMWCRFIDSPLIITWMQCMT